VCDALHGTLFHTRVEPCISNIISLIQCVEHESDVCFAPANRFDARFSDRGEKDANVCYCERSGTNDISLELREYKEDSVSRSTLVS
jgi:hypothetical protein